MKVCFAIIGSIASTTRKFVNYVECKLKDTLFLKRKKITKTGCGLKNNLDLTKEKIFVNAIL